MPIMMHVPLYLSTFEVLRNIQTFTTTGRQELQTKNTACRPVCTLSTTHVSLSFVVIKVNTNRVQACNGTHKERKQRCQKYLLLGVRIDVKH